MNLPGKGFTLIELISTISIAGILLSVGIPSLSAAIANNQQNSTIMTLYGHHLYARSEAITRNQRITLCKSSNGQQCSRTAQWQDGWIIFADTNKDKQVNGTEQILRVQQQFKQGQTIKYRGFGSFNYVSYYSSGQSTTNGTFTLCNRNGAEFAKSVIISRTGRARIKNKSASGRPLTCS